MPRMLVFLSLGVLVGCQDGVGPFGDISGTWRANRVEYSLTLVLVQRGSSVTGTGDSWAFVNPPTATYAVAGTYVFPRLTLTLTGSDSTASQLTATIKDARHMIGVQHVGTFADTLVFVKQ